MAGVLENALELRGKTMYDNDGQKIGRISDIYLDNETDQPEWALVNTGMFGSNSTFVPLRGASAEQDGVRVPYDKNMVKDAPNMAEDGELSETQEQELYDYYGVGYSSGGTGAGYTDATTTTETTRTGTGTGRDDAMTRSEEELRVGKTQRESGRARLRKYIETQQVTQTVPVQREEVRIEREPITDANIDDATSGPELTEDTHEVVLHEEQAVAEKVVVPKVRVRLGTETVTEEQEVGGELRKERIDTEGDVVDTARDRGVTDTDRRF
jgi:uncharacterized protein (TIGR02271 family)